MEHLLLIEDNIADIALTQSYLRDAPFTHRLHKATSLQEGLEIIRHNDIDMVLLDLALYDTAGFNTLRLLLQEVPDVPVIVLTGTKNEVLGMQIVQAGAQDYLVKGNFDSKQLSRTIRHSMKRFKAQVELRKELWETQQRDKRYQLLHHLLQLGTWELDLLDNTMHWSIGVYQLLGYHPHSFEPKLNDYLQMVHLEDRERIKQFFEEAMRNSTPIQIKHRAVIGNRVIKYLFLNAQVISEERSDKLILVGTLQDITDMKLLENGGTLAVSTPHPSSESSNQFTRQLRQLTDKMLQSLKILESGGILKQKQQLAETKEIAARQLNLIYEQSNVGIVHNGNVAIQKETISLAALKIRIAAIVESKVLHLKAAPLLQWENPLPDTVRIDEHLVSLLLFNILHDDFCSQEEKAPLPISIEIATLSEKNTYLRLTLSVTQTPLSANLQKAYMDFINAYLGNNPISLPETEANTQHLIALAKILQALKAKLQAIGEGDIEILIPVEIPEKEAEIVNRPIRMLIVEHQTIVQIALKRMLQAEMPNISIDFAEDVAKGVQKLSEKDYDLILVDIQLPTTKPLEVVAAFKKTKDVAFMALASEFSKQEKANLRNLGVGAFVIKPPQREALLLSMRNILQA